jgi:hypothetical protein
VTSIAGCSGPRVNCVNPCQFPFVWGKTVRLGTFTSSTSNVPLILGGVKELVNSQQMTNVSRGHKRESRRMPTEKPGAVDDHRFPLGLWCKSQHIWRAEDSIYRCRVGMGDFPSEIHYYSILSRCLESVCTCLRSPHSSSFSQPRSLLQLRVSSIRLCSVNQIDAVYILPFSPISGR